MTSFNKKWIPFLGDRLTSSSTIDIHFEQISTKSFRLILIFAISALLFIALRGILVGGLIPWADTANLIFLTGIFLLVFFTKINWRSLAWIVLLSFILNTFDGLIPLSINPITPTHLLLPLLVLYGAILGSLSLSLVAAGFVLGIYSTTAIIYWPLSRVDILKLTNLMLLTVIAATAAYVVWSYHRKMLNNLKIKTVDLEKELDINLQLNAVIFHDICNPLTAIFGAVGLARQRKHFDLTEIELINENAGRISSIIDSVRELNAGVLRPLPLSRIKVSEIVHDLKHVFKSHLDLKEQSLSLIEGGAIEVVSHAAVLCNSVLSNILSNAIKFSNRGASIKINASEEENFVRIEVHDQGKGFPKAILEKIIKGEKYSSFTGTEQEKGQGYGLRIAAMYLQRLQGRLEIRNSEEGGAAVSILLPSVKEKIFNSNISTTETK